MKVEYNGKEYNLEIGKITAKKKINFGKLVGEIKTDNKQLAILELLSSKGIDAKELEGKGMQEILRSVDISVVKEIIALSRASIDIETLEHNTYLTLRIMQAILDVSGTDDDFKKGFNGDVKSEFWEIFDVGECEEVINSFRVRATL